MDIDLETAKELSTNLMTFSRNDLKENKEAKKAKKAKKAIVTLSVALFENTTKYKNGSLEEEQYINNMNIAIANVDTYLKSNPLWTSKLKPNVVNIYRPIDTVSIQNKIEACKERIEKIKSTKGKEYNAGMKCLNRMTRTVADYSNSVRALDRGEKIKIFTQFYQEMDEELNNLDIIGLSFFELLIKDIKEYMNTAIEDFNARHETQFKPFKIAKSKIQIFKDIKEQLNQARSSDNLKPIDTHDDNKLGGNRP